MKSVPVVEAKARFSALLAEVEAGEEIAVTRGNMGRPLCAWSRTILAKGGRRFSRFLGRCP